MIRKRVPARVGLLGNPSDGYNGKVISLAISNFWAEVTIEPAEKILIYPNLKDDGYEHENLKKLAETTESAGYLGGLQLLLAVCTIFSNHCEAKGVILRKSGFSLRYTSNIPRQCGLSGSSAIIIACLKCLIAFFGVSESIPLSSWPGLALQAEKELGITAGLQDRVIQVYEGLVYMDFEASHMRQNGLPRIEHLPPGNLPSLYLIYCKDPSSSGKMHANIRERFEQGDTKVISSLSGIAKLAELGRQVIAECDHSELGKLMDQNFALRRQLVGDNQLGRTNLRMVEIIKSHGGSAKLTGSGGAIVAYFPEIEKQTEIIWTAASQCQQEGFSLVKIEAALSATSLG